jgi:hypothetical protein
MKEEILSVNGSELNPVSATDTHGLQRYMFGLDIVLESTSWRGAEEKIDHFFEYEWSGPRSLSYYSEGSLVLWREYQLLFMCQFLEFRAAELIGHLYGIGCLKDQLLTKLSGKRKAKPERVKHPRRLVSPASLLVDLGVPLEGLIKIVEEDTLPFDRKDDIVTALLTFKSGRNDFIHHSFNREKKLTTTSGDLVAETLQCGKRVLTLITEIIGSEVTSERTSPTAIKVGGD